MGGNDEPSSMDVVVDDLIALPTQVFKCLESSLHGDASVPRLCSHSQLHLISGENPGTSKLYKNNNL